MLFNSLEFFIFFPTVFVTYFSLPHRYRWVLLLIASYYFYMSWEPYYIVLILLSTLVDYYAGLWMYGTDNTSTKKLFLLVSILTNLGILFTFKYYGFFTTSLAKLTTVAGYSISFPQWNVLLPIGISFYTFQSMSYTIDVYRGVKEQETNFIKFALYVAFFPQLVAGPIERSTRLLPQFENYVSLDYDRVVSGMKLATWGMFQKVVIADRLGIYVDDIYQHPHEFSSAMLVIGTIFFDFQLLCDFQGYTNIAQGTAKMLGFNLMKNFRQPLFATSIPRFWRRFHISLTTWFRDYLYLPLLRLRPGAILRVGITMFYFSVIGLWHGANLTFLIFGIYHAVLFLIYRSLESFRLSPAQHFGRPGNVFAALLSTHLFSASGVWFRGEDLSSAFHIFSSLPAGICDLYMGFWTASFWSNLQWKYLTLKETNFILSVILIVLWLTVETFDYYTSFWNWVNQQNSFLRWTIYFILIYGIFFLGVWKQYEFIYFQF